jgi:hypothetical protein
VDSFRFHIPFNANEIIARSLARYRLCYLVDVKRVFRDATIFVFKEVVLGLTAVHTFDARQVAAMIDLFAAVFYSGHEIATGTGVLVETSGIEKILCSNKVLC